MQANSAVFKCSGDLRTRCATHLTERLTERLRRSVGDSRWDPATPPDPGDDTDVYRRRRDPRSFLNRQRLVLYLRTHRHAELRHELARAELAGEISEFYALSFQAVLAMAEGSELAAEYLEMAEAVASSPYERAIIAEDRAAYDLLHDNPSAAAARCLATLDQVHQTEGLWVSLLIALYRLGKVATIDATLRRLTRLDGECTTRIVGLLSTDPDLHGVRARPACQQLLGQHARGG